LGHALGEQAKVSKVYALITFVALILDCCIFIVFLSHMGGAEAEAKHEPVNAFSKITFFAGFIVADLYLLFWCLYQQRMHLPSIRKEDKPTLSSAMPKAILMGSTSDLGIAWDIDALKET